MFPWVFVLVLALVWATPSYAKSELCGSQAEVRAEAGPRGALESSANAGARRQIHESWKVSLMGHQPVRPGEIVETQLDVRGENWLETFYREIGEDFRMSGTRFVLFESEKRNSTVLLRGLVTPAQMRTRLEVNRYGKMRIIARNAETHRRGISFLPRPGEDFEIHKSGSQVFFIVGPYGNMVRWEAVLESGNEVVLYGHGLKKGNLHRIPVKGGKLKTDTGTKRAFEIEFSSRLVRTFEDGIFEAGLPFSQFREARVYPDPSKITVADIPLREQPKLREDSETIVGRFSRAKPGDLPFEIWDLNTLMPALYRMRATDDVLDLFLAVVRSTEKTRKREHALFQFFTDTTIKEFSFQLDPTELNWDSLAIQFRLRRLEKGKIAVDVTKTREFEGISESYGATFAE